MALRPPTKMQRPLQRSQSCTPIICSAQSDDLRNLPIGPDHQIASSGCAICRSVQITRLRRQAAQSADRSRSPDCVVRLRNLPIGPDHQIASSGCAICRLVQITRLRRQAAQSADRSRSPDCVVRLRNLPIGPDHQIASSGCAIWRSRFRVVVLQRIALLRTNSPSANE